MSGVLDVAKKVYLTVRRRATPVRTVQLAQTTQPAPTQMMQVHTDSVSAVAFFKDSQRVVIGSDDTTLRIWDLKKGELVEGLFEGHGDSVFSVAISPDDRRIASGGRDESIIIWDVENKQMVFNPLVKHRDTVWSMCFSPNGKRLATGSDDCTVVIWDVQTGTVLSTLWGQRKVLSVAFSPDGLKLASGSWRTIRVWRTDNAELLLEITAVCKKVDSSDILRMKKINK